MKQPGCMFICKNVCVCVCERERERQRETERDRDRERQRQRETETERDRGEAGQEHGGRRMGDRDRDPKSKLDSESIHTDEL